MTQREATEPFIGPIRSVQDIPWPAGQAVYRKWRAYAGVRSMAARSQFSMTDLHDVLSTMYFVAVERDPLRFVMRLTGMSLHAALEAEWAGRDVAELPNSAPFIERFTKLVADRTPYVMVNVEASWSQYPEDVINAIVLPLGENGETVDTILGVIDHLDHQLLTAWSARDF